MKNINEIKAEIAELRGEFKKIMNRAKSERRDLTDGEQKRCDAISGIGDEYDSDYQEGEISKLKKDLARAEKREQMMKDSIDQDIATGRLTIPGGSVSASGPKRLTNNAGQSAVMFAKGDSFAEYARQTAEYRNFASDGLGGASGCENVFGEIIKAMATGTTARTPAMIKNVLSEGTDSAGGVMVPSVLAASVIDKARAKSVVMRAGASLLTTETNDTTIARVTGDPAIAAKAENALFPDEDITFVGVTLGAHTIGCVVTASREVIADGTNMDLAVEMVLARSLAAQVDKFALQGAGTTEPLGIFNIPGISETDVSAAAIDWFTVANAAKEVRNSNHEPGGYTLDVLQQHELQTQFATDGQWLAAPPALNGVGSLSSSHVPAQKLVIGDWSNFIWGLRQGVMIEMSKDAGEAFQRHQLKFKITWRGDFNVMDESAFHRVINLADPTA